MTTKYTQYPYCKPANDAEYSTSVSRHESIHGKARINWFILGSWSVMLIMCIAFLAAIISLFM